MNNVSVGTATVIVTGEGNYDGVCKKTFKINKANVNDASIVGLQNTAYTGSAITPTISLKIGDRLLVNNADYTVSYENNITVGTATVTVTGIGNYEGTSRATFIISKAANTLTASGKTVTLKAKTLNKKNQTITVGKAYTVTKAQGTVTYKKTSGNKKITVAKNGKITVKKGIKKGNYKVKINVTAAGNGNYNAGTKKVTVTIKIK